MKVAIGSLLRAAKPVLGSLAVAALVVGCGDKESDPDAVSVEDLKFPGDLTIVDNGNGAIKLWWSGSNNEPDFDGYNIYGMKEPSGGFGLEEGKSLQLLDTEGNPIQASRDILAKFNYDPATGLESVGTGAATADAEGEEPEFSALPIHTGAADARMLPTCMNVNGVCTNTSATTQGQTVSDNSAFAVNGPIEYSLDGLKVGSKYCFLILSSMDGGEKVSQTSSNFECVTPNYKAEFTLPTVTDRTTTAVEFDVAGALAACTDTGCTIGDDQFKADAGPHNAADTGAVYIEKGTFPEFIAGKNSGVVDLGYYANGFSDALLPTETPVLVLDSNGFVAGGGYSVPGQSINIKAGHMYVLAIGDAAGDATQTAFKYHWVYVKNDDLDVEMRLQK